MAGSGGSIRLRADGRWEGRYWSEGRRRSVFGRTKREAQEQLRASLTASDNGIRPVSQRLTVAAYLADWLETSVRPRCRPSTLESYAATVRLRIVPAIGNVQLAKLQPEHIARMLAKLTARGDLSPTTVRYVLIVLRIALGRAMKTGKVLRNAATLVDPPARARPEMHPLDAVQVRALLEAVEADRLGPLYKLAIATGMRQGELLALRWCDVDLESNAVAVRHTLRPGTSDLAEPKTERSRRTLRLGAEATACLHEQRRHQRIERLAAGTKWQDKDFVFTTRIGTPLDSTNVTHALQHALARAGLPRQRFHDLRHAYATLMLEDGEELMVVSRSLGHSQISTTADVYAHLTPTMLERSAARMDAILGRRTS